MPDPDFRALCAELVDKIEGMVPFGPDEEHLTNRAIAALVQPEPAGPTDEEIAQFVDTWWENMQGFAPHGDKTVYTVFEFVAREHFADFARDALDRWATPANTTREEN
jgi:hypothetical protein